MDEIKCPVCGQDAQCDTMVFGDEGNDCIFCSENCYEAFIEMQEEWMNADCELEQKQWEDRE